MATNDRQTTNGGKAADTTKAELAARTALRNGHAIMDELTELFRQLPVFVPMWPRSKRPRIRKFQTLHLGYYDHNDYLTCIGQPTGNVAVLLGEASGGLCTFDFDDDDNAQTFLQLNPRFYETLHTTARRGRNLWFIVDGEFPGSFDVRDYEEKGQNIVEFRADGRLTIILGTHPNGAAYRMINGEHPIRVRWDEIVWPEAWSDQVRRLTEPPRQRAKRAAALPDGEQAAAGLTLDRAKLENVVDLENGRYNARCPACAETGHDTTGNHLIVFPDGRFGCVVSPGDGEEAREHRRTVLRLAGA